MRTFPDQGLRDLTMAGRGPEPGDPQP